MSVWNSLVISSGSTTASTAGDTWTYWCGVDYSTTNSTNVAMNVTSGTVWRIWTNSGSVNTYTAPQMTEADRRAIEERRKQSEAEQKQREQERAEAEARAEKLLADHLSEAQAAMLARMKEFIVVGSKGNRYTIRRGRAQNVYKMDGERRASQLCAHPSEFVPDPDTMLAQKLMLEADEDEFVRIANVRQLT